MLRLLWSGMVQVQVSVIVIVHNIGGISVIGLPRCAAQAS